MQPCPKLEDKGKHLRNIDFSHNLVVYSECRQDNDVPLLYILSILAFSLKVDAYWYHDYGEQSRFL